MPDKTTYCQFWRDRVKDILDTMEVMRLSIGASNTGETASNTNAQATAAITEVNLTNQNVRRDNEGSTAATTAAILNTETPIYILPNTIISETASVLGSFEISPEKAFQTALIATESAYAVLAVLYLILSFAVKRQTTDQKENTCWYGAENTSYLFRLLSLILSFISVGKIAHDQEVDAPSIIIVGMSIFCARAASVAEARAAETNCAPASPATPPRHSNTTPAGGTGNESNA